MTGRARFAGLGLLAAAGVALAATDGRGWSTGTVAVNTPNVVASPAELPIVLPKRVAEAVTGPTLLFYFSPTCPHCRHVAGEVQALSERLAAGGKARVLGIASGSSSEADLLEFRATYAVTFEILVDTARDIQAAMGVTSTPSAMLVVPAAPTGAKSPHAGPGPKGKPDIVVRDAWRPYLPGWDALVEARVTGDVWSVFQRDVYLGNNVCGVCHVEEHASWRLSFHAVAWRTLERQGATADAACTKCHVTGAGAPSGWDQDPDSLLVDVGCEACHGPGGPHDGARAEPKDACASCHDADHSIAFTLEKGLPLIDHYRANTLSPQAYDDQRRALWMGEVPRDLLAFPAGANVGSAACLGCHPVEHGSWASGAHANAMTSLAKEGSTDPACVRCHATARRSGPPPDTLAGFDTLGGVGCESCHGPGEAHVAAKGGTTNIQGLGESCPVCVIDAVCTSCHTPKWSPDWNLERALEEGVHATLSR